VTSGLSEKTDILRAVRHFGFVPATEVAFSLDHLVGEREKRRRIVNAVCAARFEQRRNRARGLWELRAATSVPASGAIKASAPTPATCSRRSTAASPKASIRVTSKKPPQYLLS